jgi:nucleoside-diphosphate-sugar epimerase
VKICVTGGSGFIGTHLTRVLLAAGHTETIYDLRKSRAYPEWSIQGDVRDGDALSAALRGHDAVIHLAAEHRDDVRPLSLYEEVNVDGARQLVRAADSCGCKRIIFTSSVAVYPLNAGEPDEEFRPDPFNPYGASKWKAEQVFEEWAASRPDVSLTIVRPCVVFGENNRGNVYNLLRQIANKRFLMVGTGENRKSMAYVGNVVSFLAHCLGLPAGRHLYNYADKPDLSALEIVEIVRAELGMAGKIGFRLPYSFGLAAGYSADVLAWATGRRLALSSIRIRKFCANTTVGTTRLDQTSGFTRAFSLPEALRRMVRYEFIEFGSQGKELTEGGG